MSGIVKKKILAESDDEEAERAKKKLKKAEPSLFNDDDDDDDDATLYGKKREPDHISSANKKRSPSISKIGSSKTGSSNIDSGKRDSNIVESKDKKGNKNKTKTDKTVKRQAKGIKENTEIIISSDDNKSDESKKNYNGNSKLKNTSSSRHSNSSPNPPNFPNVQSPKNVGKKGELAKLMAAQNTYDIRSFFKSGKSSNNVDDKEQFQSNANQIPLKDVSEYFDKLENDQNKKQTKSNSPNNIKKERSGNNDDMSPVQKKIKTDTGGRSPTSVKDNSDGTIPSFDYLLLNNQKIVITGVFSKYTRDELTYKIKELGGSVMSAVSSKTNYLIHGELLEDGRLYTEGNKYKKAKDLLTQGKSNIKILNEEEFLQLLPENNNEDRSPTNAYNEYGGNSNVEGGVSPNLKGEMYSNNSNTFNVQTNEFDTTEQTTLGGANNKEGDVINQLWVEKYRPKNISELVGNNTNVVKLQNWLASWEDVCIRGFKKEVKKTFRGVFENVNAPCALLSGPAGIGKTTTAKIVAEQSGYNVIEFNASDERNKAAVEKINEMASGGYTLTSMHNTKLRKTCIIMDEVDGMSSGDKGGSTAILKLIEKTKCPIICICNDRQNPKIRTLANKCYDLKFHAPQKQAVIKRVMQIALKEGLVLEPNALELLCDSTNSDLRQILNTLQLLSKTYKRMNFADIKKELSNSNKTLLTLANPFEVCLKLLNFNEASKLKIRDIIDLFFVDHELIPFFISENYANIFNDNNKADLEKKWDGYGKIAFDLSLAEIVKYDLKTNMDFSLLPHFCVLCCVCPVLRIRLLKCYMSGRVNFPSALGKISSFNKNKRLLQELCFCLSFKLNVSPKVLITSGFLNYLYVKLITPLSKNNPQETLDIMEEYNITKEMITEHFPCLRLQKQENLYDKLDSKTKSAFTRLYNSSHVIKTDPNLLKNTFKTDKKAAASFKLTDRDSDEEDGGDTTDAASKDDDDDPLIKNTLSRKQTMKGGKTTPRAKAGGKKKK